MGTTTTRMGFYKPANGESGWGASVNGNFDKADTYWPVEDVRWHGAVADGTTDIVSAITAAVAALPSVGGIVYIPAGVYAAASNIASALADKENIWLVGDGCQHSLYWGAPVLGTVIKATSSMAVLCDWEASTAAQSLRGNGIRGISFDGNGLAARGIKLASHFGFKMDEVHVHNCTTSGIDLTTVNLTGVEDFQSAQFGNISIHVAGQISAKGMTWSSWSAGGGNVSLCVFHRLAIYTQNGTALECGDSDHNIVHMLNSNHSGTGLALDLLGSATAGSGYCRTNRFEMVDGPGGVTSRGFASGTQPAMFNYVGISVGSNSAVFPTVEAGSSLTVADLWSD